jgi:hypothetical protein
MKTPYYEENRVEEVRRSRPVKNHYSGSKDRESYDEGPPAA